MLRRGDPANGWERSGDDKAPTNRKHAKARSHASDITRALNSISRMRRDIS
jgi:hypothetical protein